MWRWAVIVLVAVVAHLEVASAGNVQCISLLQSYGSAFACGASSPETGYCVPIRSATISTVPASSPASVAGFLDFQFASLGAPAVGAVCPVSTSIVVMNKGDYDAMIQAANVVTKLQEGYELGTVALLVLGLLAGFWIGYRAVQRGSSQ